jgi:iron(III) transport system permease protein
MALSTTSTMLQGLRARWGSGLGVTGAGVSPWTVATLALVALVLVPILTVLKGVLGPGSDTWSHLASTVLWEYVRTSGLLLLRVGALTLAIGVPAAWLVTTCDFPGRRFLSWGLILPLAIPSYIIAFTYAEIVNHGGPVQSALQWLIPGASTLWVRPAVMSPTGVAILLALVLYPYVYLVSRASFQKQTGGVLESARLLGRGATATFFRVALPLARPAVVGGVTLVLMEVLNEYGAVRYFGVPTFTTGIFRTWSGMNDFAATMRLSACLLLFVFLLVGVERGLRGRRRFDEGASAGRPLPRTPLKGWRGWGAALACGVPFLLGFVVPVLQLLAWAVQRPGDFTDPRFLGLTSNTFGLALVAALLTVSAALLVVYAVRLSPTPFLRTASRVSMLGYAVPGVIVALGLLFPMGWMDRTIDAFARERFGVATGLLLSGTVAALVVAYLVRFLAVALAPVDSGFERICGKLDETSRSLGVSPLRTLFRVNLPLLRGTLLGAGLLVFVDVLKELPLTLVLRPFNFDTLATRAFQLAMDERVAESAFPALLIVAVGLLPVSLLNRVMTREVGRR